MEIIDELRSIRISELRYSFEFQIAAGNVQGFLRQSKISTLYRDKTVPYYAIHLLEVTPHFNHFSSAFDNKGFVKYQPVVTEELYFSVELNVA